jgi:hypothetical protein
MKKIFLDLSECNALGDTICATPVIRVLYKSYDSLINVITKYPDVFLGNPCVGNAYLPNAINIDYVKRDHIYHNSFKNIGKKNENGVEMKHNRIDIRQFHAINLGFMLDHNEMVCEYFSKPAKPEIRDIVCGFGHYICLHPVQTWPSRTWAAENWQLLADKLSDYGLPVILIGKNASETGFFNVDKPVLDIRVPHPGIDLMNKTSIADCWHLISNSLCFVTMDSGLLHLAGTTETNIIQLGSSINPSFRSPYTKGAYHYVGGSCKSFCASDMKHGVKEWGDINGVAPLIGCLEKKPTFECHPSVSDVYQKIKTCYNA